ncbi:hypothetical protein RJT34_18544 [Clitoria ternatea]|uniref:Uncharacterized protein n=1 Tax=Clitoria ternatea TaxID=43366 RepID=A0AAN9JD85_CLITE
MVDSVVTVLLANLQRFLEDEINLLSGVEDKVRSLQHELKFVDIFLKSSTGKRNDKSVKEVVDQIREVAQKAEDVVDIYIANDTRHRQRNKLSKLLHLKEHVMVLHEVNAEIVKIENSIEEIYNNRERYCIIEGESGREQFAAAESLRERRRDVEEKDVVGFVNDSRVVIGKLMEGDSDRKVVSIIGMGGLGKTTLTRKIYNSNQVKDLFPCRAWGYVSNDYRPTELLQCLLKCLLSMAEYNALFKKKQDGDEVDAMSDGKLKKKLEECLKGKKYLIVLDDIWKTEAWDDVERAFPDDKNGSRILITSRIQQVAHYTGSTSPYNLPSLNKEESWELFTRKVFRGRECPSDLESPGKSIVESCKGLPLAIEVLAGLVAKKEKSEREWLRMKKISWKLTEDKFEVMDILRLSYNNLPQRLKPCFLYLAVYPEDYEIRARDVIQMWIAEGFIQPHEGGMSSTGAPEPEDIAEYYLDELVDRSLVQVSSRRSLDRGVRTCRIHDLLRDLCISEGKSEKLVEVSTNINKIDSLINARRLSLHCKVESNVFTKEANQQRTRSLFFFSNREGEFPKNVLTEFKLARVVYTTTTEAPLPYSYWLAYTTINWERMIHLRYLNIQGKVKHIPASVSNLWNLETLDVGWVKTVSCEIWKLKRLKHLYLRDAKRVALPPESGGEIKINLQTLWLGIRRFTFRNRYKGIVLRLKPDIFPQLKKLVLGSPSFRISGQRLGNFSRLLDPLPSLSHISNLQSLKTFGQFEPQSDDANAFPSNLTKLTLKDLELQDDFFSISTLGQLTNLRIMKLIYQLDDCRFHLKLVAGDFPQLEVFEMREINVCKWTLQKGAMPRLRHLVIHDCKCLDELPQQLWCLTTSPRVHVLKPNHALAKSLLQVEFKDGSKPIISL